MGCLFLNMKSVVEGWGLRMELYKKGCLFLKFLALWLWELDCFQIWNTLKANKSVWLVNYKCSSRTNPSSLGTPTNAKAIYSWRWCLWCIQDNFKDWWERRFNIYWSNQFISPEKLVVPVVVMTAVFIYWVCGLMFAFDVIVMY